MISAARVADARNRRIAEAPQGVEHIGKAEVGRRHTGTLRTLGFGRLRRPTDFALPLAHGPSGTRQLASDLLAVDACKHPIVLVGWALARAAAGLIIAVRSERTGPTEPVRLTEWMSWVLPYAWLPRCAVDRSWRPYIPRWCENYACTLYATVGRQPGWRSRAGDVGVRWSIGLRTVFAAFGRSLARRHEPRVPRAKQKPQPKGTETLVMR